MNCTGVPICACSGAVTVPLFIGIISVVILGVGMTGPSCAQKLADVNNMTRRVIATRRMEENPTAEALLSVRNDKVVLCVSIFDIFLF